MSEGRLEQGLPKKKQTKTGAFSERFRLEKGAGFLFSFRLLCISRRSRSVCGGSFLVSGDAAAGGKFGIQAGAGGAAEAAVHAGAVG